jgi:two-component system LytT family response regulator
MKRQMPEEDGFSFLGRFSNFSVVFATAYNTYAIKAIRFSALEYLLKPINKNELKDAIEKFKNRPVKEQQLTEFKSNIKTGTYFDKLGIPTQTEIYFIKMETILYLESDNNYTKIYTSSGSPIMSSKNIGYYEELLDGLNFFRIHNSYIINLKKIVRYVRGKAGSVELENGVNLEISKRKKEQFLKFPDLV